MTDKQKLDAVLMLLGQNNNIIVPEIHNRKETNQEMKQRIFKNHNEHKALRAIKKNLC